MLIPTKNRLYDFDADLAQKGRQLLGEMYVEVVGKGELDIDRYNTPSLCLTEFPDCCAVMLAHNFHLDALPRGHRTSILKSLPEIAAWLGYTYVLFADTVPDKGCLDKIRGFKNSRTGNTVTLHGGKV